MDREKQKKTPILDAIKAYVASNPIPFDVPGHKMGRLENDFEDYVGKRVYQCDVNAPIGIDNLYHGTGVIKKAEELYADAFGADKAILLINGTTSGIMTMIMGTIKAKEKIILPRNVHKSVINSLIVSGAYPVFVQPDYDKDLGISNGVSLKNYIRAMDENKDAKAIFVINPTYFGVASDLKALVKAAHERNMMVLCDEAHGAHLVFNENLPISAMKAGADISAASMHKTGGSLTQSSILLIKGHRVHYNRIKKAYAMFGSTSPSHLLLASLDAARKKMALEGKEIIDDCLKMTKAAREKINSLPGLHCLDKSYCDKSTGKFDFDETKLVIQVNELGLTGFEVYHLLREKFNIQLELAEVCLVLAIVSPGTKQEDVDALVRGMTYLSNKFYKEGKNNSLKMMEYHYPELGCRPREAFHAPSILMKIEDSIGCLSSESVMVYPPGIPLLIPGEVIPQDIVELYDFYKKHKGVIMSDSPKGYIRVINMKRWKKSGDYDF